MRAARRVLRPAGTVTLIWRAEAIAKVFAALESGFGAVTVLPVHPRPDAAAIRVLVRATKASRAASVLLPGITLNARSGDTPADVQAILDGSAVLPLATA